MISLSGDGYIITPTYYLFACVYSLSLLPYLLSALLVNKSTSAVIYFDFHCLVSALTGCEKSNKLRFSVCTEGV